MSASANARDYTPAHAQALLVGTSAALFVPAVVSFYSQPFLVTLIIAIAASVSVAYHSYREAKHGTTDMIFSHITMLVVATAFTLVIVRRGFFHWRTLLTLVLSVLSLFVYATVGYREPVETAVARALGRQVPCCGGGGGGGGPLREADSDESSPGADRTGNYVFYHSAWHILSAAAVLCVVSDREIPWRLITLSYPDVLRGAAHADEVARRHHDCFFTPETCTTPA